MPYSCLVVLSYLGLQVLVYADLSGVIVKDDDFVREGKTEASIGPDKDGGFVPIEKGQAGRVRIFPFGEFRIEGRQRERTEILLVQVVANLFATGPQGDNKIFEKREFVMEVSSAGVSINVGRPRKRRHGSEKA